MVNYIRKGLTYTSWFLLNVKDFYRSGHLNASIGNNNLSNDIRMLLSCFYSSVVVFRSLKTAPNNCRFKGFIILLFYETELSTTLTL